MIRCLFAFLLAGCEFTISDTHNSNTVDDHGFKEVRMVMIRQFIAGTIGLEQLNSANEAGHIRDTVKVIVKALRQMLEDGETISDAPSRCNRQSQSFQSGENIIRYYN